MVGVLVASMVRKQRMNITAARAVLERQGIDPAAGVDALMMEIEQRGWRISLEQAAARGGVGRPARWSALATRAPQLQPRVVGFRPYLTATGPTAENVLVRVLAQALERASSSWREGNEGTTQDPGGGWG